MAEQDRIILAHGGGGTLTSELIGSRIQSRFSNPHLDAMNDSAALPSFAGKIAFTTDSFVVNPIFFPGGSLGDLAVCGTVNDLAMSGAKPKYLSLGLIIEEGFHFSDLDRILDDITARAAEAGVIIVCGDTKVVESGKADGIYINTSGIGEIPDGIEISSAAAREGDAIIVSGTLGMHGLAVMLARGNLSLSSPVESDVAPLSGIVEAIISAGVRPRVLRDLTRGGLATALTDIAAHSEKSITIDEQLLPVNQAQESACEILGLEPLHIASEGRFLAIVPEDQAEKTVGIMRRFKAASEAAIVGKVEARGRFPVSLRTKIGSVRPVTPPRGEQMPRIC